MLPLDTSIWGSPFLAVSSWWRNCVLHMTQIWSCIEITGAPQEGERLECWIRRSGDTCPIYLTVRNVKAFQALESVWPNEMPSFASRIRHL
ncbi:hypothetical protein DL93DRAFT_2075463, partial [Clavulina sp. PMI_390]